MDDPETYDPLRVFAASAGLSSFAGLAELLRSGRAVTWKSAASAAFNSAMLGLAISLVWYHYFLDQNNIYFLVGVCVLAGLGGATMVDFFLTLFRRGGINVNFTPPKDGDK